MIVSVRHDQREKPNNLKLAQRTKVLIHNQLADKAKARLPTFLHNLHLVVYYIFLILNNIHQITTCRLFENAIPPDAQAAKELHFAPNNQEWGTIPRATQCLAQKKLNNYLCGYYE